MNFSPNVEPEPITCEIHFNNKINAIGKDIMNPKKLQELPNVFTIPKHSNAMGISIVDVIVSIP